MFSEELMDDVTGEASARVCEHEFIHTQFNNAVCGVEGGE